MRTFLVLCAAHVCAVGFTGFAAVIPAKADSEPVEAQDFPILPLPPVIDGLIGIPQTYTKGRGTYLALITSEAEQQGLPAAVADAVVKVESGFNPYAVGGVGEVGLMQIRPQTAAMLGYQGGVTGLFNPETNVRLGVTYLARAWQLADGDLCRALMKYRAGWGEERMTALSVEYCRRARGHLAAIGSPLGYGALPDTTDPATPFAARPSGNRRFAAPASSAIAPARPLALAASANMEPSVPAIRLRSASSLRAKQNEAQVRADLQVPRQALGPKVASRVPSAGTRSAQVTKASAAPPLPPVRVKLASIGPVKLSEAQAQALMRARQQEKARAEKRRQIWAEHERRMDAITSKVKGQGLKIISGL